MNKRNATKNRFSTLAIHFVAAISCAACIAALILSLFSIFICNVDVPLYMIIPFATISMSIASFTAAAALAYLEGERGLIIGIATGLLVFLLLWAASALEGNYSLTGLAALKLIAYCSAGCIGGLIGVSFKERKQKRR